MSKRPAELDITKALEEWQVVRRDANKRKAELSAAIAKLEQELDEACTRIWGSLTTSATYSSAHRLQPCTFTPRANQFLKCERNLLPQVLEWLGHTSDWSHYRVDSADEWCEPCPSGSAASLRARSIIVDHHELNGVSRCPGRLPPAYEKATHVILVDADISELEPGLCELPFRKLTESDLDKPLVPASTSDGIVDDPNF
jgi:hypothetical protein